MSFAISGNYCVTVSEAVPTTPLAEALIVVEPLETGEASPELEMIATPVTLELQDALLVTSPTVPSEKVAEAVNCCV